MILGHRRAVEKAASDTRDVGTPTISSTANNRPALQPGFSRQTYALGALSMTGAVQGYAPANRIEAEEKSNDIDVLCGASESDDTDPRAWLLERPHAHHVSSVSFLRIRSVARNVPQTICTPLPQAA